MLGLDIIGAGESLAPYTIMLHVNSIDTAKLRAAVTDQPWGAAIPSAIQMVDSAPELALEVALPIVETQLVKAGINATITSTKTPPKGKSSHEMETVLGVGVVLGIALAIGGRSLYHLFNKGKTR